MFTFDSALETEYNLEYVMKENKICYNKVILMQKVHSSVTALPNDCVRI